MLIDPSHAHARVSKRSASTVMGSQPDREEQDQAFLLNAAIVPEGLYTVSPQIVQPSSFHTQYDLVGNEARASQAPSSNSVVMPTWLISPQKMTCPFSTQNTTWSGFVPVIFWPVNSAPLGLRRIGNFINLVVVWVLFGKSRRGLLSLLWSRYAAEKFEYTCGYLEDFYDNYKLLSGLKSHWERKDIIPCRLDEYLYCLANAQPPPVRLLLPLLVQIWSPRINPQPKSLGYLRVVCRLQLFLP